MQLRLLYFPVQALGEVKQASLQHGGGETAADSIHRCDFEVRHEEWWAEYLSSACSNCLVWKKLKIFKSYYKLLYN